MICRATSGGETYVGQGVQKGSEESLHMICRATSGGETKVGQSHFIAPNTPGKRSECSSIRMKWLSDPPM